MAVHPTGVKSSFGGHLIFWTLFLPLLSAILFPVFFPNQNIDESEVKMLEVFSVDVDKLTQSANSTFGTLFIDTGAMKVSEEIIAGNGPSQHSFVPGIKDGFAQHWIRGVWLMLYKAIWRLYALMQIFFIPSLALCIPALIDGLSVRARKKYRFEVQNPVFFYASTHAFTLIFGLFVFLPLAPITLSANILAAMIIAMGMSVWIASSNIQTGS